PRVHYALPLPAALPIWRKFARAVQGFGDRPEATVIGARPFRTSVRHAALLNSVFAQVLEWEDWTFLAHSGASVVPAALATAELADRKSTRLNSSHQIIS